MAKSRRKRTGANRRVRPRGGQPITYAELPEMEWIAIRRDEIVAHAPTLKELGAIVEARPDRELVVFSRIFPRGPGVW